MLVPLFHRGERVLDFGCGDMSLANKLIQQIPKLSIIGVDVVDFPSKSSGMTSMVYDGVTLPFKNNSFDVVLSFHAYHHCKNPEASYRECLRVAKKRVVFVEPIMRFYAERYSMGVMDWLFNRWKFEKIPLTYNFQRQDQWEHCITKAGCLRFTVREIKTAISFLPFGVTVLFEVFK